MRQLRAMSRFDPMWRLRCLAGVRTLVVSGEEDRIALPRYGRTLATAIPGSTYIELPNAGNTWMWSLADNPKVRQASHVASSPLGALLYRGLNASPRWLMPMVYGNKAKLTPEIHAHYLRAFRSWKERMAPWVLARELAGSGDWYASLWDRRGVLAMKPALLLWGTKDPTFGPGALARWREALPNAKAMTFADAGHFVQEEVGPTLTGYITSFLDSTRRTKPSAA